MKKQGFSLVELLISLCLLTFLITATAQVIIHSFFVKRRVEINLKIAELASLKLEYLKSLPCKSDELKEGHRSELLKGDGSKERFIRAWRIQDISSSMKRVEIEVFSESYPQKKVRLVLFISRELGF
jgi:prepilin-type N-terminal cleavage/methylation domain-containing protein